MGHEVRPYRRRGNAWSMSQDVYLLASSRPSLLVGAGFRKRGADDEVAILQRQFSCAPQTHGVNNHIGNDRSTLDVEHTHDHVLGLPQLLVTLFGHGPFVSRSLGRIHRVWTS